MHALPFHPVVNPFPIVSTVLAAGCLLLAALRAREHRGEWVQRGMLLLTVSLLAMPVVAWSGRTWAGAAGLWPRGALLPDARAAGGLLRLHALGAAGSGCLMALGLLLGIAHRRGRAPLWPVIVVLLACALATGMTAHLGGQIAFGEPDSGADR